MFKIGEFSELTNISPRMLRHYDKLNLLKPVISHKENGYRYYKPEQINQANQILSLKNIGVPLKDIKVLLANEINQTDYLIKHRKKIETELAEKKLQLAYLDRLEEKNTASISKAVNYPIEIKTINDRLVLSYRQKIESYYHEEQLWQKLFSELRPQDLANLGPSIAVFHGTDAEIIDIEVMIGIPDKLKPTYPRATMYSIGLVASVVITGAYSTIPNVHADMLEWIKLNEYILNGNIFNIYHSSPATQEQEELYITEVCYPIDKIIV